MFAQIKTNAQCAGGSGGARVRSAAGAGMGRRRYFTGRVCQRSAPPDSGSCQGCSFRSDRSSVGGQANRAKKLGVTSAWNAAGRELVSFGVKITPRPKPGGRDVTGAGGGGQAGKDCGVMGQHPTSNSQQPTSNGKGAGMAQDDFPGVGVAGTTHRLALKGFRRALKGV